MFKLIFVLFIIWIIIRFIRSILSRINKILSTNKNQLSNWQNSNSRNQSNNDRFFEVIPSTRFRTNTEVIKFPFETGSSKFIKDAKKYHNVVGKPTPHTPFMQYWPTFQALNLEQKKWYFYWRSELRKGYFPKTDLSYIFIYIYELLCLVEITEPIEAANQIKKIWLMYREIYPKLDNYLPSWGGDLVLYKVSIEAGINWWSDLLEEERIKIPPSVFNVLINRKIKNNEIEKLPYSVWAVNNPYKSKNKFCQQYNKNGYLDQEYLRAINAVDKYLKSIDSSTGIFEKYTRNKFSEQIKWIFLSAIVPAKFPSKIRLGKTKNYAESTQLASFLLSITKYTENNIRKQKKYSAKLSGFELGDDIRQVIDKVTQLPEKEEKSPPVKIILDVERIEKLNEESKIVAELLEPDHTQIIKPKYSDIEKVRSLWQNLNSPSKSLLLNLYKSNFQSIESYSELDKSLDLSSELIHKINDLSLKILGDHIISIEKNKQILIAEDYLDEMELIEKENQLFLIQKESSEKSETDSRGTWQQFIYSLSDHEVEFLEQFTNKGVLNEDEIEIIARSYGKMSGSFFDSIAEKAFDNLKRPLFYQEGKNWIIDEEDLEKLREIYFKALL